jgi:hypothetical protein
VARILQGILYKWQLGDSPIGSGDAGEVYAARCLDAPEIEGVVKKPARVATGGTIQRQANQIAREALALLRLDGLPDCKAHPPRLLDEAPEITNNTANYFIVSEAAPGEAMDAMLAQTRQEGKPFPRRVIITVLDALFDLFSRAHKAGVLWNDVKLDHIYWHNPTGDVTVIDWGNALFLDQPKDGSRPTPPRWEDYRQFVDTLGGFLQSSAPDLYADLGWDEFTGTELDLPTISILARRIAYQQEVIALKMMEYQALINVVLSADPDLPGLLDINEYQGILEKIGAPWPREEVLAYGAGLIQALASAGDTQSCLQGTAQMFTIFGENLDLSWHLLREVYRQPGLISHPDLAVLVRHTLNQNWLEALWRLVKIGAERPNPPWWKSLVPVLRQQAVGLVTPPPFTICQSLFEWINSQEGQAHKALAEVSLSRQEWRQKGTSPKESPFDYSLMETLSKERSLPNRFKVQLRESYAVGEKAIRELLQAWLTLNWESLEANLKQVLAWDPDRWALIKLGDGLTSFQHWLKTLYVGPEPGTDSRDFLLSMKKAIPPIDEALGQPPWFHSLTQTLSLLAQGSGTRPSINDGLRRWCPWVLSAPDLNGSGTLPVTDETEIEKTLSHFMGHLRSWSDIDAGLQAVRESAPAYYPACKNLAAAFQESLTLNFDPEPYQTLCTHIPHRVLKEACDALSILLRWRSSLSEGDLSTAENTICPTESDQWQILQHAYETTCWWQSTISPWLQGMLENKTDIKKSENVPGAEALSAIAEDTANINATWNKMTRIGIEISWLEALEESIEKARMQFLAWRKGFEHAKNPLERLVYHSQIEAIRQISAKLLRLSQHIRLARLCFSELGGKVRSNTSSLEALDKFLTHLDVIESILVQVPSARKIPGWQSTLEQIRDTPTSAERRKVVLSLTDDHPLYTWLVDSIK